MSATEHLGQQWSIVHHPTSHPFGGQWATVHTQAGEQIGHMRYRTGSDPFTMQPGHTTVEYIHVDPEQRGQGIAKALYQGVHEQTGEPYIHYRDDMSPAAKKTVASSAADNPEMHKVLDFRGGKRGVRAYPRRSR